MNAIELTTRLRDAHGHDVVIFAAPGPMQRMIEEKGIRYIPAPDASHHPSWVRMSALWRALAAEKPDVMHVWDWWQCLDAYYGAHLFGRMPMVVSDMQSESINRLLPKSLLTTFGTPQFVAQAKARGRKKVELLLPPVDTDLNAPGAVDPSPFRERHNIDPGELTIVVVSRLVQHLKGESLRRVIDAVGKLGKTVPIRLLIVGDGHARAELERVGETINHALRRDAIVFTGPLLDPRPAYAAADVVLGMGSSALRGMAFAKPVVVLGANGFSLPFNPQTADWFYFRGLFGRGDGDPENRLLVAQLHALACRRTQFPELGEFGRRFVVEHFALKVVAAKLDRLMRSAAAEPPRVYASVRDAARTAAVIVGGKIRRGLRGNQLIRRLPELGSVSGKQSVRVNTAPITS